jgi:predicted PurR-regulated permease PerM
MKESLLSNLKNKLNNASIRQLLHFILLSCNTAILILAISIIFIEKFSYDSQKDLMQNVVGIETLIKNLNNTITALIVRNTNINSSNTENYLKNNSSMISQP